jgi:hypothetical protein
MRNISDTTATWFVVLGILGILALTSLLPTHSEARREFQEPSVQRLSLNSSELADAAANARVPAGHSDPVDELWWAPSEQSPSTIAPGAGHGQGDLLVQADMPTKRVAAEPHRTWFCSLFRFRTPST